MSKCLWEKRDGIRHSDEDMGRLIVAANILRANKLKSEADRIPLPTIAAWAEFPLEQIQQIQQKLCLLGEFIPDHIVPMVGSAPRFQPDTVLRLHCNCNAANVGALAAANSNLQIRFRSDQFRSQRPAPDLAFKHPPHSGIPFH